MTFRELPIGAAFVFAAERDPKLIASGFARGPWRKISPRKYRKTGRVRTEYQVGTVHADVIQLDEQPGM